LRERKKAKTRAAIQSEALRLIRERGYGATTVEDIIEAAEVSESTFYRYFPTKADVVITDDYDPIMVEAFLAQPAGMTTLQAIREAFSEISSSMSQADRAEIRERSLLILSEPELRATSLDQLVGGMRMLADACAKRTGLPPSAPAVRALAGALVGIAISVMFALVEDPSADFAALFDEALAQLETGFDI
jgi:AcrR family transcriptional regulator